MGPIFFRRDVFSALFPPESLLGNATAWAHGPPLECLGGGGGGQHAYSHFLWKGFCLGPISRENQENGMFFVIANGNQYPR